jgi:hypothetical protein
VLIDVQRLLLLACAQPDPAGWLRQQCERTDTGLTAAERDMLRAADADGLRLTHVLVTKLRLERLMRGDARAAADAAATPEEFMARFVRYAAEVAPTAVFPSEEAVLFQAWSERRT